MALGVQQKLLKIADSYGDIIKDTAAVTSASEKALGISLKNKEALEKEIAADNAERARIESLVTDLQEEVVKFEKKARELESRANTAEERAFVLSLVQIGAQMVSAAMPAIAMALGAAATGGTSVVAASALNTMSRKTTNTKPDDNDSEIIKTKTDISKKTAEKTASEEKKEELTKKITTLETEKSKLVKGEEGDDEPDSETSKPKDAKQDSDAESGKGSSKKQDSSSEVKALEKRINTAKDELKEEDEKLKKINGVLEALQAALNKLEEKLGKLSDEQQQQANSLRDMQMKMLDKVETYEREKRSQTAELAKINALLKGKRNEDETIQLAITSLNLSLSALKRMREIIEEIAFFFKSFADFMGQVSNEAQQQVESIDKVAGMENLRKYRLAALIESTDRFFITQAGEWNAAINVADKFAQNFADGWSKLNKLNGTYIRGDELAAYFKTASDKISLIVNERDAAAEQKIADLNGYRKQIAASAVA